MKQAPSTGGVDVRKVGLWSFIGSECVFFASLISTYVVYKSAQYRPDPAPRFSTFR